MLVLKMYEMCPYSANCSHNSDRKCYGALEKRASTFTCEFVKNGQISKEGFRSEYDQTGKMKILLEEDNHGESKFNNII